MRAFLQITIARLKVSFAFAITFHSESTIPIGEEKPCHNKL